MIQRMYGYGPKEAYKNLALIRTHTFEGVGDWRIETAENLVSQLQLLSIDIDEESKENKEQKDVKIDEEKKEEDDVEADLEMIKKISQSSDRHRSPERKEDLKSEEKLECGLYDEKDLCKAPGWA